MSTAVVSPKRGRRRVIGALLLALGLAGVALVMGVPALHLGAQEKKKGVSPVRLVPADAAEFIHIRFAELLKSKFVQLIAKEDRQMILRDVAFGFPPEQIETVTIVSMEPWLILGGMGMFPGDFAPDTPRVTDPPKSPDLPKDGSPRDKAPPPVEKAKDRPSRDGDKDKPASDKPATDKRGGASPVRFEEFGGRKDVGEKDKGEPGREDRPERSGPILIVTFKANITEAQLEKMMPGEVVKLKGKTYIRGVPYSLHLLNNRTVLAGRDIGYLQAFAARPVQGAFKGTMAPALEIAASGKHTLTIGLAVPPKTLKEDFAQFMDRDLFGLRGVYRALGPLAQATPAVVAFDLNKFAAIGEFHYTDDAMAKKGAAAAQDLLVLARIFGLSVLEEMFINPTAPLEPAQLEAVSMVKLLMSELDDAFRAAHVETKDKKVYVSAHLASDFAKLQEKAKVAVKDLLKDPSFLEGRRKTMSSNNLKQIGLALHNFHDTFKALPPQAICDANGKPLLSWRVAILPYIEENPLYQQFKLDEPWDSPNNIKLLEKMPKIYTPIGVKTKEPFTTFYQAFSGPGTAFEMRPGKGPFHAVGMRIVDFTDGTSNTVMVGEALEPVPWTKPADLDFDPKGPLPKLGGLFAPGYHLLFADASVRFVARPLPNETLRAVITRAGGEAINLP